MDAASIRAWVVAHKWLIAAAFTAAGLYVGGNKAAAAAAIVGALSGGMVRVGGPPKVDAAQLPPNHPFLP